jgi:hypothetical protein
MDRASIDKHNLPLCTTNQLISRLFSTDMKILLSVSVWLLFFSLCILFQLGAQELNARITVNEGQGAGEQVGLYYLQNALSEQINNRR